MTQFSTLCTFVGDGVMRYLLALGPLAVIGLAWLWLRRTLRRAHLDDVQARAHADSLIAPLTKDRYRFKDHDDRLRVMTLARRDAADRIRAKALRVESGSKSSEVLRMVK